MMGFEARTIEYASMSEGQYLFLSAALVRIPHKKVSEDLSCLWFHAQSCLIIPGHPRGGIFKYLCRVFLKRYKIIESIDFLMTKFHEHPLREVSCP